MSYNRKPQRIVSGSLEQRCDQCWEWKPWPSEFLGAKGKPINRCKDCQARYKGWAEKTPEERAAAQRGTGVPVTTELRARLFRSSHNHKLGGIPSSATSRGTCPPSCGLYNAGCYSEYHVLAHHWKRVSVRGDSWVQFCADVAALPENQLWRHNVAGDLPGYGERIDPRLISQLVDANWGRHGFTFTHKHGTRKNRDLIREANASGLTINLSADSLREADRLAAYDVAPVAVVVHSSTPDRGTMTPGGRRVVVCPAQTAADLTCAECRLCAHPRRICIVGFRAHGPGAYRVEPRLQLPVIQ